MVVPLIRLASLITQLVKESACNAGDPGSIPGSRSSAGEGNGSPLQYSGLENSMDCVVYRVAESQTRLSDFHSLENGALSKCSGPDLDQLKLNL